MKPVDIYQINPAWKVVISTRSDIRLRALPENACCMWLRELAGLDIPDRGIYKLSLNFCPVCGRKIERNEKPRKAPAGQQPALLTRAGADNRSQPVYKRFWGIFKGVLRRCFRAKNRKGGNKS